ncbi:hypothetical protein [Spiroplasma poulsonii]|uniref:hypothetical protein n=1 Tax=Spiroplasma poulsonii TaxID=2138 RepID=UPI001F4C9D76|nr:hypothetical protein [Spiroplasma poulsonii]UNF62257.1 hypothetical protein MNU24_02010 [Spiroplasma poulsonii]
MHQHTIAVKTGETNNRNLDISNQHNVDLFVSNLERWEVGILAITNHNLFDLEQFNFLEDIVQSKGILLLPGIEIDIEDSEGKIHNMNIIVSNEDKKIWDEFVLSLNITDPNNFSIPVYALTQKLSKFNKICLIPNNQKGGKELPKDDYNLFSDENSIYFFETTNLDSSRILAHKGIPAICGSDEKDILNPQYNKIPDIHIKIDSFTSLINFFKKDLNFMKNKLSEKLFGTISIHPSTWQDAIKVPLYYDTNIIIGSRGSGKSIILEEIKKEVERVKNIKIDLYDHKDDNYNRLLKELESQFLNPIDLNSEIQNLNILLDLHLLVKNCKIFV